MLADILGWGFVLVMLWCAIGGVLNDKSTANKTGSFHNGIGPD